MTKPVKFTAEIDSEMDPAVIASLINEVHAAVARASAGRPFKVSHNGDPRLSELANEEYERWSDYRWE